MATSLSDGYIYLIESDSVANDDWITDHAGDPDSVDLSLFTAGTEYCKLEIPEEFQKGFHTGIVVEQGSAGSSYDLRSERRWYDLLASGIETSIANADLVDQFCMTAAHTSGDATTFERYYLIIRFAASNYVNFTDDSGNRKEYCKGVITDGRIIWQKSRPSLAMVRLNWRSVW